MCKRNCCIQIGRTNSERVTWVLFALEHRLIVSIVVNPVTPLPFEVYNRICSLNPTLMAPFRTEELSAQEVNELMEVCTHSLLPFA